MIKINAPPAIKQDVLKAIVGIDSIHILIKMNRADLKRFCIDRGFRYKSKVDIRWQRKWFIFLAEGEPITATYHSRSRTIKFEIGKLMNYSIKQNMHEFTQQLVSFFADREQTVGRIDISVDVNKKRDDLIVKNLSKIISNKRVSSTTYHNAKGIVFIAYDKSYDLKIYSTDLTRLELRLSTQLTSWKVKDFLSNRKSLDKLVKKVDEYFRNKVEIYSNDRLTLYTLRITDMESVLLDFVAFVHGDTFNPSLPSIFKPDPPKALLAI